MPQNLHVGLVYGGQSTEHDVSIRSARNVFAMLGDRHCVTPILITRDGRWIVQAPAALAPEAQANGASGGGHPAMFAPMSETCSVLEGGEAIRELDLDVVFPILHGQNGEDGRIQGFLHTLGLPFVGPDVLGSAACWDKEVTKRLLEHAGLPVTPYLTVRRDDDIAWESLADTLGSPVFVKPCSSGSSVGVTKVSASGELADALALGFEYDRKLLIETGIDGREIECAVLGNETPEASVPGEIVSTAQFYTYDAKYEDPDASRMEVPADLPPEIAETIRVLALEAYRALECEGMARVDFFYTASGEVMINEINTIPGFTSRSMYPVMWAHSGLDNEALVDRLLVLAIERHARDAAVRTTR